MDKLIIFAIAASLGACASQTAERRPAATAQTEPVPHQTREERARERATTQHDVRPVEVAPVVAPARVASPNDRVRDAHAEPGVTDQSNSDSDVSNARKIRQAVMDDDSLSLAAKNSQIISNQGEVTLRGRVKTEQEKRAIEKYARQVAGTTHVHNDLSVEP